MNSNATPYSESRYTPFEALSVTGLKPETLQTWVNRGNIKLGDQHPGRGKRRLYSAIDVVKLAIMRRTDQLGIALAIGIDIAEGAEERLRRDGLFEWDLSISFRSPDDQSVAVIASGGRLAKYGPIVGDDWHGRVSDFTYPLETEFPRRVRAALGDPDYTSDRPIDPEKRERLARQGIHAEPVIIFPLGEIVNGALLQLATIDEAEPNSDV